MPPRHARVDLLGLSRTTRLSRAPRAATCIAAHAARPRATPHQPPLPALPHRRGAPCGRPRTPHRRGSPARRSAGRAARPTAPLPKRWPFAGPPPAGPASGARGATPAPADRDPRRRSPSNRVAPARADRRRRDPPPRLPAGRLPLPHRPPLPATAHRRPAPRGPPRHRAARTSHPTTRVHQTCPAAPSPPSSRPSPSPAAPTPSHLTRTSAQAAPTQLAFPLPARSHLTTRAHATQRPAGDERRAHPRPRAHDVRQPPKPARRVLVAGCVNGTTLRRNRRRQRRHDRAARRPTPSSGTSPRCDPGGADLDATPGPPGRAGLPPGRRRPAPDGSRSTSAPAREPLVRAAGPSTPRAAATPASPACRTRAAQREGLAAWAASAQPGTAAITVELPAGRASKRQATRLAYAIDRLAGTRFAEGALQDRRRMIAIGHDPRESRH